MLARELQAELGESATVVSIEPEEGGRQRAPHRFAVQLTDGNVITIALPPPPNRLPALISTVSFLVVALILLFLWVARALTAPIANFVDAAERFSLDRTNEPVMERGPTEIRRLGTALNEMGKRIRSLVEDRTRMLAAVGHDLRTPITRLRLRAEDIEDKNLRTQIVRDLDAMQYMVQSALSFLREHTAAKSKQILVDLPSLLQTLCDDFVDMGHKFKLVSPAHLYIECDPDQITRAVVNLVDNALKYGRLVEVAITDQGESIFVDVGDDGPGIADTDKVKVLEPFYRVDAARRSEKGSFGLGLSIVHTIVEAHQGRIELHDREPHGLLVRLVLPKKQTGPLTSR